MWLVRKQRFRGLWHVLRFSNKLYRIFMIQSGCFGCSVFFRCECFECIPVCGYPPASASLHASHCPCLCPSRSAYRIANLSMPPLGSFDLFVCFNKWTVPLRCSPMVYTRLLSNRVGVNVVKGQRPARKRYRSSRRRVLYFPCLYRLRYCRWRHLLPLGTDNRRV